MNPHGTTWGATLTTMLFLVVYAALFVLQERKDQVIQIYHSMTQQI
jgi:hypothetical protein